MVREFTDRKQSTRLGTSLSDELTITHGVPQGSILGPFLFNLCINDLPSAVKSSCTNSYVDDSKIYCSFSVKNMNSCLVKMTEDLHLIAGWCCSHQFLINPNSFFSEQGSFSVRYQTSECLSLTKSSLRYPQLKT